MNAHGSLLKRRIRDLRSKGRTYAEIQAEVGYIPKSSLAYICKNVDPGREYTARLKQINRANLLSARKLALEAKALSMVKKAEFAREEAYRIVRSHKEVDRDKVALAILYLGEGRKSNSYKGLSLGGSDPTTLRIYLSLLEKCYKISKREVRAAVQYRADQSLDNLMQYWKQQLGLAPKQFYGTKPDPRTVGKPTKRLDYKGVCVVTCRGADIQVELAMIADEYAKLVWGYSSAD